LLFLLFIGFFIAFRWKLPHNLHPLDVRLEGAVGAQWLACEKILQRRMSPLAIAQTRRRIGRQDAGRHRFMSRQGKLNARPTSLLVDVRNRVVDCLSCGLC
jgi:hypothetical protein